MGNIAYMFQKDLLCSLGARWWQNTALGLEMEGLNKKADAREAVRSRYSNRFGLGGFADVYPDQLSGGMRQRAAFARTVVQERSVMLLDEPFGALDSFTRTEMQQWLLGVWEGRPPHHTVHHPRRRGGRVPVGSRVRHEPPAGPDCHDARTSRLPRPRSLELEVTEAFSELERELKKRELHGHASDISEPAWHERPDHRLRVDRSSR